MFAKLECTKEFVGRYEDLKGFGPWSDEKIRDKVSNSYLFLEHVFKQGVLAENLELSYAKQSPGRRRNALPTDFGKLFAEFSNVVAFADVGSPTSENAGAYSCLLHMTGFDMWFCCAFVHARGANGAPQPTFFCVFCWAKAILCRSFEGSHAQAKRR